MNERWNARRVLRVALVGSLLLVAACAPGPTGPEAIASTRPYCPFDNNVVIYGGDSLVTKWPAYVELPADLAPYNTAKGGVMYSADYLLDPSQGSIGSRVLRELDACGNDVGVAVFGGGGVDISTGTPVGDVTAAIDRLDEELFARGVPTVFVTLTPVADTTIWYPAHQTDRRAVNAWMTTPGNLHATVVDCVPALESSPGSDILARKFWNITDVFGSVDLLHPNEAGYDAIAECAKPSILAALGR